MTGFVIFWGWKKVNYILIYKICLVSELEGKGVMGNKFPQSSARQKREE